MIDIIKQTPIEYSNQSRDYQIIARLYTALFNYNKAYIDNLNIWDSNIDNKLVYLRAKTLNLDTKHSWDLDELEAVTSCFKFLMRNKGTVSSIKYCINILLRSLGLSTALEDSNIIIDSDTKLITVKADVSSLTSGVIEDLLKYLLPAGWNYRIIQYTTYSGSGVNLTELKYAEDKVKAIELKNSFRMTIGNDDEKKRFVTHTYVYNDEIGRNLPESEVITYETDQIPLGLNAGDTMLNRVSEVIVSNNSDDDDMGV